MNTGMHLTFDLLAVTPNVAADRMLTLSLESAHAEVRRLGVGASLRRSGSALPALILRMWDQLTERELRTVQDRPAALQPIVSEVLCGDPRSPLWPRALAAMRMLNFHALLPMVIDRLESEPEGPQSAALLATVLELSASLGAAAREGRGRPSIRQPIVVRLSESVQMFENHRCEGLCEAFLAASSWGDRTLRFLLIDDPQGARRLARPLCCSSAPGIIQLVAGFVRRREIPAVVRQAIELRPDDAFRDCLLRVIGDSPSQVAIRNLRNSNRLECLRDHATLVGRTPNSLRGPLLRAHSANHPDPLVRLEVILDVVARGDGAADKAAAVSLASLPAFDDQALLAAAAALADGTAGVDRIPRSVPAEERPDRSLATAATREARAFASGPAEGQADAAAGSSPAWIGLVSRTIALLDHPHPSVAEGLRKLLRPLHIDRYLEWTDVASAEDVRRLGELVLRIDPQAADVVGDELRSPVLSHRVRAIRAAVACDLVKRHAKLLAHAALHDHREARIMAIEALATADCEEAIEVLERIARGPLSGVRDAAIAAVEMRDSRNLACHQPM